MKTTFGFLGIFTDSTREVQQNGFVSGSETELGSVVVESATSTAFCFPPASAKLWGLVFFRNTEFRPWILIRELSSFGHIIFMLYFV